MTDAEWIDKYMALTADRCTSAEASRIAEMTLKIEEVRDVRVLGDALSLQAGCG
jgi:pantothenate kinase